MLAALLPIIASMTAGRREGVLLVIDFAGWGVFLVDLLVHVRHSRGYLRRGIGMFDLSIVVVTFPWYIIPGFENTDIVLLARLARVARLFMAGTRVGPFRSLVERLGRAALMRVCWSPCAHWCSRRSSTTQAVSTTTATRSGSASSR